MLQCEFVSACYYITGQESSVSLYFRFDRETKRHKQKNASRSLHLDLEHSLDTLLLERSKKIRFVASDQHGDLFILSELVGQNIVQISMQVDRGKIERLETHCFFISHSNTN